MKNNLIKIAVLATFGMISVTASAEDMYRGAWYVLPGISYMNTDNDLNANNGGGGFLRFGKELSPSWEIQGGAAYNTGSESGIPGAGGRYKQTTLSVDALYMFSRDKFRPFLLAGVGVARNNLRYHDIPNPPDTSKNIRTGWMGSLGLGAQYLFSDKFGLQADVREQWSLARGGIADTISGKMGNGSQTVNNTIFSLGAIYRFGEPTPKAVVAEATPEPAAAAAAAPLPEETPATPAVAEPVPAVVPCTPKFETVTISAEKLFGFDQFKLQEGAKPILDGVVAKMKEHPEFKLVMVNGYTDRIGNEKYNQKLSERRANEVKSYIVSQGIEGSRLESVGKGESNPVEACKGVKGKKLVECLAPNRRVEISENEQHEIEGQPGCK
jgi:OOP family OmpA-OmpF porin